MFDRPFLGALVFGMLFAIARIPVAAKIVEGEAYVGVPSAGKLDIVSFGGVLVFEDGFSGGNATLRSLDPDYPIARLERGRLVCRNNTFCLAANNVFHHMEEGIEYFTAIGVNFPSRFRAYVNVPSIGGTPYIASAELRQYAPEMASDPSVGTSIADSSADEQGTSSAQSATPLVVVGDTANDNPPALVFSVPFLEGSFWIWEGDLVVSLLGRYVVSELLRIGGGFDFSHPDVALFIEQAGYYFGASYGGDPRISEDFLGKIKKKSVVLGEAKLLRHVELLWYIHELLRVEEDDEEAEEKAINDFERTVVLFLKTMKPEMLRETQQSYEALAYLLLENELKVSGGKHWNLILKSLEAFGYVKQGKIQPVEIKEVSADPSPPKPISTGATRDDDSISKAPQGTQNEEKKADKGKGCGLLIVQEKQDADDRFAEFLLLPCVFASGMFLMCRRYLRKTAKNL